MESHVAARWMLALNAAAFLLLGGMVKEESRPENAVLAIIPVGDVDARTLSWAIQSAHNGLGLIVHVEARQEMPAGAWDAVREAWDADVVLHHAQEWAPSDAWKVLVLVDVPLVVEEEPFVHNALGLGAVHGNAAVVSSATFRERSGTDASFKRRLDALVLHELGHALGLHHCPVGGCIMRASTGDAVTWADLGNNHYCVLCRMKMHAPLDDGTAHHP